MEVFFPIDEPAMINSAAIASLALIVTLGLPTILRDRLKGFGLVAIRKEVGAMPDSTRLSCPAGL
jgi:hypothetical protein